MVCFFLSFFRLKFSFAVTCFLCLFLSAECKMKCHSLWLEKEGQNTRVFIALLFFFLFLQSFDAHAHSFFLSAQDHLSLDTPGFSRPPLPRGFVFSSLPSLSLLLSGSNQSDGYQCGSYSYQVKNRRRKPMNKEATEGGGGRG